MRVVKLSVLLEFELATDLPDEQLVTDLADHVRSGVRPAWKGFHFSSSLPGTFVGKPKSVAAAIGHNVFVTAPRPRKRKR
jgi:hypothetical protein